MPTLLVSPRFSTDNEALRKAASELHWDSHRVVRYQVPKEIKDPVVYGDLNFCDNIAQENYLGLLDPPNDWLATLPFKYLLREVQAMTLYELHKVRERSFIKPANDKVFIAGIYERGAHVPKRWIDPRCPVLVSEVVDFEIEVRCYILDRRLMTAGLYAESDYYGTLATSNQTAMTEAAFEGAQQFIQYLLDDPTVKMPSALTIDVGFIAGTGWAVVEANQAYSSGIYMRGPGIGADPKKVLPVLQRAGGLRRHVLAEDEQYLRNG